MFRRWGGGGRPTPACSGGGLAALVVAAAAGIGAYAWNNLTSSARDLRRVLDAGFEETRLELASGTVLNVAEGPDSGPPAVLLHGQGAAWQSYARALPRLAERFHVFAIDVAGHGASDRTPGRYDVDHIARDVIDLITRDIGDPVLLSGHSSGGLIAAQVAATAPEIVSAVLFEDPPFFSTEPERMTRQFNFVDLARPAHAFLQQDVEHDFASWYLAHNAWIGYFGRGRDGIVSSGARYRAAHPDEPLRLWFLPPRVNESFAHMHRFDPAFADAFFTMTFGAGLDQATILAAIAVPTTLVHADWRITDAGILEGAMTDADAARACELLADCTPVRVDTGHGFHIEDPERFVTLLSDLAARA